VRACGKDVNGSAPLLYARDFGEREMSVGHRKALIRRDDIDMIRFDANVIRYLRDRNRGGVLQHFREMAFVLRRQMQDNDISHAAIGWHIGENSFKALMPPAEAPIPTTKKSSPGFTLAESTPLTSSRLKISSIQNPYYLLLQIPLFNIVKVHLSLFIRLYFVRELLWQDI
jgi:hypothetical protein